MPEEILNEPGIQSFIRQHVAGAVAQHVGVNMEPEASGFSRFTDYARHHVRADRAATLLRPFHIGSGVQHGLDVLAATDRRCPHPRQTVPPDRQLRLA